MIPLLCWLVLPLLVAIALVGPSHRGGAVARLLVPVFALASLQAAIGSLSIETMRLWGIESDSRGLFVSISCGLLLGGVGSWPPGGWRRWIAGVPLAGTLVVGLWPALRLAPLMLGTVLGALPLLLAAAWRRPLTGGATAAPSQSRGGWVATAMAAALALSPWMVAVLLAPAVSLAPGHRPGILPIVPWPRRVMPAVALALAAVTGWLAMTIAGDPFVALGGFAMLAPVSPGAERLLGLLGVAVVVAMAAPWPLHRWAPGTVLLPAAVMLAHRFATDLAPGAVPTWRPLATLILVPSLVAAAHRGHWANALGSAAVLVALQPGVPTVVAAGVALLAALVVVRGSGAADPTVSRRVTFPESRGEAVLLAAAMALAAAAVLRDEVVLATLLVAGVATAAARPVRQRPAGMSSHQSSTLPPDGSDVTRTAPASL